MPSGLAEDDAFNPVSMSQLLVHVPVSSYFLAAAAAEVDLFADIGIEARNVYEEGVLIYDVRKRIFLTSKITLALHYQSHCQDMRRPLFLV